MNFWGWLDFQTIHQPPTQRGSLWEKILSNTVGAREIELSSLLALQNNVPWISFVPVEWREIYGAMYDESSHFSIDEVERGKISKDIHRTFGLFSRNIPQFKVLLDSTAPVIYESLQSVLLASSHERGYCQGVNFLVAAFLLSEDSERNAFIIHCYLMKQLHLEVLFNPRYSSLVEYMSVFQKKLRKHNARVYSHFKAVNFGSVCFAVEWFTTLFLVTCSAEFSFCVIDLVLCGVHNAMIRVGLAIMDALEERVLACDLEQLQVNFKRWTLGLDPTVVIAAALVIPCGDDVNYLEVMSRNIDQMVPGKELNGTLLVLRKAESSDEDHEIQESVVSADVAVNGCGPSVRARRRPRRKALRKLRRKRELCASLPLGEEPFRLSKASVMVGEWSDNESVPCSQQAEPPSNAASRPSALNLWETLTSSLSQSRWIVVPGEEEGSRQEPCLSDTEVASRNDDESDPVVRSKPMRSAVSRLRSKRLRLKTHLDRRRVERSLCSDSDSSIGEGNRIHKLSKISLLSHGGGLMGDSIKPTPTTPKSALASGVVCSGSKVVGVGRPQLQPQLIEPRRLAVVSVGSTEQKVVRWLNKALHVSLWISSLGLVDKSVPGKSLIMDEEGDSDRLSRRSRPRSVASNTPGKQFA